LVEVGELGLPLGVAGDCAGDCLKYPLCGFAPLVAADEGLFTAGWLAAVGAFIL